MPAADNPFPRQPTLKVRAAMFSRLLKEPGWALLERAFRPEVRTRVSDVDSREAFLYEAIRAQVLQEVFAMPHLILRQAARAGGAPPVEDGPAGEEPPA